MKPEEIKIGEPVFYIPKMMWIVPFKVENGMVWWEDESLKTNVWDSADRFTCNPIIPPKPAMNSKRDSTADEILKSVLVTLDELEMSKGIPANREGVSPTVRIRALCSDSSSRRAEEAMQRKEILEHAQRIAALADDKPAFLRKIMD